MSIKRVALAALVASLLAIPAFGEGLRHAIPSWRWSAEAGDEAAATGYDDSSWSRVEAKGTVAPIVAGSAFWLRASVSLADLAELTGTGEEFYFLSGMSGCVFDLYVNGCYLGSRGRAAPRYDLRRTHSDVFIIPAALPGYGGSGETLQLALRCVYNDSSFPLPAFGLGDRTAANLERGAHDFWNGEFYTMLACLCVFLGIYFLILYAGKSRARENLFFGLSLVFLSLYFYEMGATYVPMGGPLFTAMGRGSMVVCVIFLYRFFACFFNFRDNKVLGTVSMVVAGLFYAAFVIVRNDESLSTLVFNASLLPAVMTIVFGIAAAISGVRRKQGGSIPLLVGITIGSFFSIHDIYYQALGLTPFAWLQGLTFFCLDVAIFVMLSVRQSRLTGQFENFAKDLALGKNELESSVARMEKAGLAAADIGRELESAVTVVAGAAESSEKRTATVGDEARRLAGRAAEADSLLDGFITSIDRINERLTEESAGIEQTATAATELQAGIESSAMSIDRTSAFAESLASLTGEGHRAADALGSSMERIAEAAKGIGEVVDAVNEFAERTNLLAMNASIEAAHAGQSGKGFGVIAGEVKKLAAAQGERARRISALAAEISDKLAEGGKESERMRTTLSRIADDAKGAALRMAEARAGANEQARASTEVRDSMRVLAESVNAIREEAARQAAYSGQVREAVSAMVSGAEESRISTDAIAREGAEIARSVRALEDLAARSLRITEDLKREPGPA